MPNNNPHGHNQYTKPELRSQKSKKPAPQPNQSGSTDAPGGRNTTHESDNGNSAGSDQPTATGGTQTSGMHTANVPHLPVSQGAPPPSVSGASTSTSTQDASSAPAAQPSGTSRRGFASMDAAMQREIASKGGHSQGRENNPGNFANDREKAREAGRKGGEAHGHR
ncbi:MAG: KGG domain-containing protein [Steroidobacteraceae bacterium]